MPEFILDTGNSAEFEALDYFTRGYIEAMFFTSTGPDDADRGLEHASVDEFAPKQIEVIKKDCDTFQNENGHTLECAYSDEYDPSQAGRDYWYTRNGHGCGFWDRDLGTLGEELSDAARHSELCLIRGDDGLLYLEG